MAQLVIDRVAQHGQHSHQHSHQNVHQMVIDNNANNENDGLDLNNNNNNNNNQNEHHQIETSFHDKDLGIYGCKHYARNCYLRAVCCNKWYCCRFCHDEDNEGLDQSNTNNGGLRHKFHNNNIQYLPLINKPHQINRYMTTDVKCMKCGTVQNASKYCINCKEDKIKMKKEKEEADDDDDDDGDDDIDENKYCFANYYCSTCKFYDNNPKKQIFHCSDCGLCRVGKKNKFIHCKKCGCCLNLKYYAKHPCIENSLKSDCPICFTYLFKSREPVTFFMPCGHPIHYDCLMEMSKFGGKCPVCRADWYDEENENRNDQNNNNNNNNNNAQNNDCNDN